VSAGVGQPIAFVAVGLGTAAVIAAARGLRGPRRTRDRPEQTSRSVLISRAAAVLIVGLVVSVANLNAFPDVPRRSLVAWVVVALVGWLPLVGGWFLLLRYIRQRIGPTEFERMVNTSRVTRSVLPGTRTLKIGFVIALVVVVSVSTVAFQFGVDHVVF
jgi:hypothetical protein